MRRGFVLGNIEKASFVLWMENLGSLFALVKEYIINV